ncbi:MAG: 3'(2'),5'-bisphosphate nucleotidase [Bacteroidetes bacterium]|nr:MAG: 3'(2'),5'-bisphosphate nucleotidase [Bacteroidota bacterium]
MKDILLESIYAAIEAGKIITNIYHTDFDVATKSDNTPVTLADKLSGKKIIDLLKHHQLPIIGEEESYFPDPSVGTIPDTYFIVDPLDGTREFIKRNGEFTVNIALIENGDPVIGVVHAPAISLLYFALKHFGAYKVSEHNVNKLYLNQNYSLNEILEMSEKLPIYNLPKTYTLVISRSHLDEKTMNYINQKRKEHSLIECIHMGSSIKMCLLAEGKAHEYPRFGRTMEWDTAAAHAVLKESGGNILDVRYVQPLKYNKKNFENPDFIAYAVY